MSNKLDLIKILNTILQYLNSGLDLQNSIIKTIKVLKLNKKQQEFVNKEILNDGINSLVNLIGQVINQEMNKNKPKNFPNFRVNEKIKFFVLHRLRIIDKFFDKKIIFSLIFKQRSLVRLNKMLFNICDEIWFLSGDTSTDFNYYSKRFILMNVYTFSFMYFLKDNSDDFSKTEIFIDKQIKSVLTFGKLKSKISGFFYSNKI